MLPRNLQPEHFTAYPPEARKLSSITSRSSGNFPSRSCRACCARSLSTISNFQRNERQSISSFRRSPRSLRRKPGNGFSRSSPSQSLQSSKASIGSIHPRNSLSNNPPTSGAHTNSMPFARLRPITAHACKQPSRRNRCLRRDSASQSLARVFPPTTSHCSAICVHTVPTSTRSNLKTACNSFSRQ